MKRRNLLAPPLLAAPALAHFANISVRAGRTVYYDSPAGECTGDAAAGALLRRRYRAPYVLPEKV